jgi:hypothetical protein
LAEPVTHLTLPAEQPPPLPESLTITHGFAPRLSSNQMRALRTETGKGMDELMGESASDEDRVQTFVWFELRRLGYQATWEQAGDVEVEFQTEQPPDPTNDEPSTSSQGSAASGG